MGVRSRLAKVFGNSIPAPIVAAEAAAQMTPASPFSPGTPIGPYDGFSRTPRSQNFVTGVNISTRPRTHERVAFETLRGLVEAYDIAQMCIWHRIDSIRSLDWSLVPERGFSGDADEAIAIGMAALEKPDRQTPFANWLAKWLYDVLAYDAGTLYRLRNRGGRAIGLRVVDGTSIAPLLDYWGNSPEATVPGGPEPEAYVQFVNGLPWNWLTRSDLIYEPFRPRSNSPYGHAPLESILLNANTDLRFQAYFLQRFTEGNIPEAFASAPESWTPDQIEQFQTLWDATMLGDQAIKSQVKWMPGGSTLAWSNEKDFSDSFSLFLMRKTCAAYHIVPSDLGFTEGVNRSSGETQADVQHRVGDLPLIAHIQGILTHFLRHDLGLPLEFCFDTGQEKEDRLALAQAWQIYIDSGMASADEGREQLLGLPGDPRRPTPRFYSTSRLGPVPLLAIEGVAGRVDPETFGPSEDQPVLYQPFVPPPGVVPAEGTTDATASLQAEDAYQSQVRDQLQSEGAPVAKDGAPTPTAGITTATGIASYDLVGHDDEEESEDQEQLAKTELAAFRRFRQARRRAGVWRDFEFRTVDTLQAHRLNDAGRLAVRKAADEVAVAGLAVQAQDTGRVLMLQRALSDDDPAAGHWEFPGGHLEGAENPLQGAWREWAEETGCIPPPGVQTGIWTSADGIYQGIVWTVPSENCVPVGSERSTVSNPDDPDGDCVEAIAWWAPEQLPDNPAIRPELLASINEVMAALGGDAVEKATAGPKGDAPGQGASQGWPGWHLDERTVDHWAPLIADALAGALTVHAAEQLARDYLAEHPAPDGEPDKDTLTRTAITWLAARRLDLATPLAGILGGVWIDSHLVGLASALATVDRHRPDLGDWQPGDTDTARRLIDEMGGTDDLNEQLDSIPEAAQPIADTRLKDLAHELVKGTLIGASVAVIGAALRGRLTNPRLAAAIAITEITRSSSAAALFGYQLRLITETRWAVDPSSNICPVCTRNGAAGPVPIGAAFPSGDRYPPAHPHCRCAIVPA